jgi:hypothetical protein
VFSPNDEVEIDRPLGRNIHGAWARASILFKANQFGRGMWQIRYADNGAQDTVHESRMRIVQREVTS